MSRVVAWLLLGTTAACIKDPHSAVIAPHQLGTDQARVSGVFATPSGGHHEGLTLTKNMPWAAIVDEAVLARTSPEVCIDLTLRSAVMYDEPLDAYSPELTVDGIRVDTVITAGAVVRHDDSVERHHRICTQAAARSVRLHMTHPKLTFRSSMTGRRRYQLDFAWRIK